MDEKGLILGEVIISTFGSRHLGIVYTPIFAHPSFENSSRERRPSAMHSLRPARRFLGHLHHLHRHHRRAFTSSGCFYSPASATATTPSSSANPDTSAPPTSTEASRAAAAALVDQGLVASRAGRLDDAERHFASALGGLAEAAAADGDDEAAAELAQASDEARNAHNGLGLVHLARGDGAAASAALAEAWHIIELGVGVGADDYADRGGLLMDLAANLTVNPDAVEGGGVGVGGDEGGGGGDAATMRSNGAAVLSTAERYEEAERMLKRARFALDRAYSPSPAAQAAAASNLAVLLEVRFSWGCRLSPVVLSLGLEGSVIVHVMIVRSQGIVKATLPQMIEKASWLVGCAHV